MATFPKKTGIMDFDGCVYYLESQTAKEIAEKVSAVLPETPDDDGAYILTCTVDDGVATLSWEAAE